MEKIEEYTSVLHRQRICAYCGGTETIQWRRGPDGKGNSYISYKGVKFYKSRAYLKEFLFVYFVYHLVLLTSIDVLSTSVF